MCSCNDKKLSVAPGAMTVTRTSDGLEDNRGRILVYYLGDEEPHNLTLGVTDYGERKYMDKFFVLKEHYVSYPNLFKAA